MVSLYVAPDGKPSGDGSIGSPFQSVEAARDAIRDLKTSAGLPQDGVEIVIRGGDYTLSESLVLDYRDSGTASSPVVYRAADDAQVRFFGGAVLPVSAFTPVEDAGFLNRLVDQDARDKILVVDLSALGITDLGELCPHGWNLEPPDRVAPAMLTIGGQRMTLARWPNAGEESPYLDQRGQSVDLLGMASYVEVIDPGPARPAGSWWLDSTFMNTGGTFRVEFDRMKHWHQPDSVYLDGILAATWEWTYNRIASVNLEEKTITLARGEKSGLGVKLKSSHFHFENVPEEMDVPGEYFIDRENGRLYVYPPDGYERKTFVLSSLADPLIDIRGASHIRFKGIRFDTGRHLGIRIDGGKNIEIDHCTIANFTLGGADLDGEDHRVANCEIVGNGGFGVLLKGGNLRTLVPGNNRVENCRIHDFGWDQKSQIPGVWINGVGNKALHNEIYDAPHFGIRVAKANDTLIEGNEIHHLPNYHKLDGGALYIISSSNPERRGNVVKNNYFHHVPSNGVYVDNLTMGVLVEGNVFYDVASLGATFSAIKFNSGGQNIARSNVIVDCLRPIIMSDYALKNVFDSQIDKWRQTVAKFAPIIDEDPHGKYPDFREFLTFVTDDDFKYSKSYVENNLIVNREVAIDPSCAGDGVLDKIGTLVLSGNWVTEEDPGFVNYADRDLELLPGAKAYERIEGFAPGLFSDMGADLPHLEVLDNLGYAFPEASFLNDLWFLDSTIGYLNYRHYPWLYHRSQTGVDGLGWLWHVVQDNPGLVLYSPDISYFWTDTPFVFPHIYSLETLEWMLYVDSDVSG